MVTCLDGNEKQVSLGLVSCMQLIVGKCPIRFTTKKFKTGQIPFGFKLGINREHIEDQFEQNVAQMHERKIIMECDLSPDELEPEVTKFLKENNFFLIDTFESSDDPNFRKLKAYAEGKYDHKDVGLLVIIQKINF